MDQPETHGLYVEQIDRAGHGNGRAIPPVIEPCDTGIDTGTRDLCHVPLGQIADAVSNSDPDVEEPLRRFAPADGIPLLLVAAGFNSAI